MEKLELLGFEVENLLRIRSLKVTIPPDGSLVIGGDNGEGKTSALRSLELGFAGGDATTAEDPIHGDEDRAHVLARFAGDDGTRYKLEKQWRRTKKGIESKLVIKKNDNTKPEPSPQTMWAQFLNFYSLDPVKWLRLPESEQEKDIAELQGVDLAPFAARRAVAFEARRDANSSVKRLKGALASAPFDPKAPTDEQSIKDLTAELKRRQEHNSTGTELDRDIQDASGAVTTAANDLDRTEKIIADMQAKLDAALRDRETVLKTVALAKQARTDAITAASRFAPADEDEITDQIATLEERNDQVRGNANHKRIALELDNAKAAAFACQANLDDVDAEEAAARAQAEDKIPVPGLSLADGRVLYNGKPLSQAGRSAGIRVGCGIAMAKNADSPVKMLLIDDGETLSPKHQREIVEEATARGFIVIMTMVSGRGPSHVEIVDGVGATS